MPVVLPKVSVEAMNELGSCAASTGQRIRFAVLAPKLHHRCSVSLRARWFWLVAVAAWSCAGVSKGNDAPSITTYADYGSMALTSLLSNYYHDGEWKMNSSKHAHNHDWGDDTMTYALCFRWSLADDLSLPPRLEALAHSMKPPPPPLTTPHGRWSDEFLWDSVAGSLEYKATGNSLALEKAKSGFAYVDATTPDIFSGGAAPGIYFQRPNHGYNGLKTAETDTNYVRAALLLYQCTKNADYLSKAKVHYEDIRRYYLDPAGSELYSVYVFDDGATFHQLKGRYFGSVNGLMIENGMLLCECTGDKSYLEQAVGTARAVDSKLSDARGIYADLQAENDVTEPLVEAMYKLGSIYHQVFAQKWIMRNASASVSEIQPATGLYGRFFDGPPPSAAISEHQSNGGLALAFAAAAIDPKGIPTPGAWTKAVLHNAEITTASLPATITTTGSGIALIGTLGEQKKEGGHARVLIDGVETTDTTGIWQDKSTCGVVPQSILFAWRWPSTGTHTITIDRAEKNPKEGGTFIHIQGYLVEP